MSQPIGDPMKSEDSSDALQRLFDLPAFATSGSVALKPGLDRMRALMKGMGSPEGGREIILVAGTNGKGSVASMIAAMSTASGIRTGLHTSPHLLHVGERMRVDGAAAPTEWLAGQIERLGTLFGEIQPSFFEATVALSMLWFAEHDASRWVIEVGLGGRLDATNALDPNVSVITSIGMDHEALLGPTLADIAREKAGIARPDRPLVVGSLPDEAMQAVRSQAEKVGAHLIRSGASRSLRTEESGVWTLPGHHRTLRDVSLPLGGAHQADNALLALDTTDILAEMSNSTPLEEDFLRLGLEQVHRLSGLRGRQEWVTPWCMVDVGHNPDALSTTFQAFSAAMQRYPLAQSPRVVLGFVQDKDVESVGRLLVDLGQQRSLDVHAVDMPGPRGLSASQTGRRLRAGGWGGQLNEGPWQDALSSSRDSGPLTLVAGSHILAAQAIEWLENRV